MFWCVPWVYGPVLYNNINDLGKKNNLVNY